jgi:outer membrane protein OmpA-like peptidoglycan-associated protein
MVAKPIRAHALVAGFVSALLLLATATTHAQDSLPAKDSLFGPQRSALQTAQQNQVDVLAPISFAQAKAQLIDAEKDYDKARKLEKIREKLTQSEAMLAQAAKFAQASRTTLATPLKARDDAAAAQADKYAHDAWLRASERFADAAGKVEKNDIAGAQKRGAEAEVLLRDTELLAIKGGILGEAQALIAKADAAKVADLAPRTLNAAKKYVQQADLEIARSRYDSDVPKGLAAQAVYEARHALYLAEVIGRLQEKKKDEHALEEMLLSWEDPLKRMAAELGTNPRFDDGYLRPTQELLERIQQLQRDNRQQKLDLADRDGQLAMLNTEMKRLEDKLGGVSEERVALQRRLDTQARLRANIAQVENAFTPNEARVFRQGDDLVISLMGITFPVGKSTIEPSSFALMTKVQEAIKLFPKATLIVEGHTDSDGSDSANLILSQDRADAVKQYLISNTGLDAEKISSIGYGETRPVASNQNAEGKARNRRIDLVLQIGSAQ